MPKLTRELYNVPRYRKGVGSAVLTLYALSIYPSVQKQLIRTRSEAHIVQIVQYTYIFLYCKCFVPNNTAIPFQ